LKQINRLQLELPAYWIVAAVLFAAMCWIMLGCEQAAQPQKTEILAFTAKWCGYCKADKPCLIANQMAGIDVIQVDVDERPDLVRKYGIRKVPSYVVLFPDGSAITTSSLCAAYYVVKESQ